MRMVERAAAALEQELDGDFQAWDARHTTTSPTRMARAVLKAIREPTEAMVDAGNTKQASLGVWQAMIDAALKE